MRENLRHVDGSVGVDLQHWPSTGDRLGDLVVPELLGGADTVRQFLRAGLVDEVHLALSPTLLGQGEAEKALTYLSAANLSAPKNPDIQYHVAVALNRLGRIADAQSMLETLLGSGVTFSDKSEAEKLLQQLKQG